MQVSNNLQRNSAATGAHADQILPIGAQGAAVCKPIEGSQRTLSERIHNVRQMPRVSDAFVRDITRSADPSLASGKASYEMVEGELYGRGGPKLSDVEQGALGDCYFLAAVGAVVADDPAAIRNAITDNHDGTYSVRFYKPNGDAVSIKVDGDLPVDSKGRLIYAKAADSDGDGKLELWVPLMEKAYAKYKDKYGGTDSSSGYADIGNGGSPRKAIQTLTGTPAVTHTLPKSDAALQDMLEAANNGSQVVASVHTGGGGWLAKHSYTVVGTEEVDGEIMVTLRNPWGSKEPDGAVKGEDTNDGLFSVPLDEFRKHATYVSSNERPHSFAYDLLNLFR